MTKTLPDQVSDAVFQVKDKVDDLSRSATEKIETARAAAAAGLDATASALHNGGEKAADLAHDAADQLSSSAKYLRKQDAQGLYSDFRGMVKRNPGMSLLLAGFVGFAVARALTSHD